MPSMCMRCTQVHNMINRTNNSCIYGSVVFLVIFFSGIPYLPQDQPSCLPHAQQHWVPCIFTLKLPGESSLITRSTPHVRKGSGNINWCRFLVLQTQQLYMSHKYYYIGICKTMKTIHEMIPPFSLLEGGID